MKPRLVSFLDLLLGLEEDHHLAVVLIPPTTKAEEVSLEIVQELEQSGLVHTALSRRLKSGQQRMLMSRKLRSKFPDKEFYFFLYDTLDYQGLEDFPFIECWVNTMCPRIGYDDTNKIAKPIVNLGELGEEW